MTQGTRNSITNYHIKAKNAPLKSTINKSGRTKVIDRNLELRFNLWLNGFLYIII